MSEHQPKSNQKKEWYKHGWGLVVAILFFPYFLVWYAWAKSKWSQGVKIAVTAIVAIVMLPIIIGIATTDTSQQSADTNNEQTAVSQDSSNDKAEPKNEKILADKVKQALDNLGEDMKRTLASTSPDGYQGDIISVEPATYDNTVKVNVSTYFKDSGDGTDGGQGIARRIFSNICFDVPELGSLYVVSSSGLESKSVYRSQIPGCKQ